MSEETSSRDTWTSNLGVIMAVAGSAVGIGNFLRFPGQAAQFGGGAFMVAYFISLVILGLPIAWMEWIMGRYGGKRGYFSAAGVLHACWRHPLAKYAGVMGIVTLLLLYTYFSYVEAWCLGYATNFFAGNMSFASVEQSSAFWGNFVGMGEDGAGLGLSFDKVGVFLFVVFIINFYLVYRGISKGIERYCKIAIPSLIIIAVFVLIRVLTLGAPDGSKPEQNITDGLGFMWNPTKIFLQEKVDGHWVNKHEVVGLRSIQKQQILVQGRPEKMRLREVTLCEQLKRPRLWLAAASQIFFSLAAGFGAIMVYASHTKKNDDLVLSSITAVSANEFSEVCLGGLISLPAAYAFLGAAGVVGQGVFTLGFNILPMVFSMMPLGNLFGGLFFLLLFMASISGILCSLQSVIAFFEETLSIGRKRSVALLGMIAGMASILVYYFSKDIKFMDTLDFWVGTFLIFTVTMANVIIYGWAFGMDKAFKEAHEGACIKIPKVFKFITKYICPVYLLSIFILWVALDVFGLGGSGVDYHILDLIGTEERAPSMVAWLAVSMIMVVSLFLCALASRAPKYKLD